MPNFSRSLFLRQGHVPAKGSPDRLPTVWTATKVTPYRIRLLAVLLLISAFLMIIFQPLGIANAEKPRQDIPPSYKAVAENDQFKLYVDSDTLAFKLLDKRSNYLWHSGIDKLEQGDRLNKSWQAFALSGLSIEYLDETAVNKRISITNAKHAMNVTAIDNGIAAQVTFEDFGITVGLQLQLEADGVRVELPFKDIREENPKYRLGLIYVYPFFGAARGSSISGYMLIPDGTGGLIHFADTTKAKNMFYGRYYGSDLGILARMPFDPNVRAPYNISYPVYGMVHGERQNGFVSIIEQGAAFSELQAHPAGITTNFNFLCNVFIYNQSYFQATNRSGAGVTTIQKQINNFDAIMHYRFLTGNAADYVGMARSYQKYLVDTGILHKTTESATRMSIRLEFLGGDKEKVLLWDRFVPMTTIQQMTDILNELNMMDADVVYYGWQPYGASSMAPMSLSLDGGVGSLNELRALNDKIIAAGGHFSLYFDPLAAKYQESGSYSSRNDLAIAITGVNIEGYNLRSYNYYFTFDAMQHRYTALIDSVAQQIKSGLALDSIASMLYSDFRNGRQLNRQEAIKSYQTLLANAPMRLSFYTPNDYLWKNANAYYDMPLGDNGYIYTSEPVPFLPIVLAGYMPYYGEALNFSSSMQNDLLRQVDYGIYPSYFVTNAPTSDMLNTPSLWIYTSAYAQWGDQIRQTYQWMNNLLGPVRGQEIIAREKLADGVYATTYANGKQIIVNYTDQPMIYRGKTVEAKNAVLVESML